MYTCYFPMKPIFFLKSFVDSLFQIYINIMQITKSIPFQSQNSKMKRNINKKAPGQPVLPGAF